MKKRYKIKYDYIAAAKKISKHIMREADIIFEEDSNIHRDLMVHNVLDYFCEELPPEVEQWKDCWFDIKLRVNSTHNVSDDIFKKAILLIRMQSWADYHNNLDGFVADWKDKERKKYGVKIEEHGAVIDWFRHGNLFLFQIVVVSEERAQQMLSYFCKDIQSLIDKGLI